MKTLIPISAIPVSLKAKHRLEYREERYNGYGFLNLQSPKDARKLAKDYAEIFGGPEPSSGDIYGAGFIVTAWRTLLAEFSLAPQPYEDAATAALKIIIPDREKEMDSVRGHFSHSYPPAKESSNFMRWILVKLAQDNPAFSSFARLHQLPDEKNESFLCWAALESIDKTLHRRPPEADTLLSTLKRPIVIAPNSVKDQLLYILTHWAGILGDWTHLLLGALDMIEEETRLRLPGPGEVRGPGLEQLDESARFSLDDDWMPRVVLLAKNTLVWLDQLSKTYQRSIRRLDEVPDEELNLIVSRGFNALWLIGLWERSPASREIKWHMGNPQAAASAYSLYRYDIAEELGGWLALENLRERSAQRGIRLSSDMVPNHVGIDSDWVRHNPERLLSVSECPYPEYSFFGDDLSGDNEVDIRLEDHYWNRSDAAVVFQRRDTKTGEIRFIYHGNDGTSMPWNDTAQINFLNPEAREAVIQEILHVARHFPIIRFDAAMVLARKHIHRLWFPAPGSGGGIPSRSEHSLSDEEFALALPKEFWREVVDRIAAEAPGTLLLAEAFWMMEGYFVRSLGMHRVYNSAFMNMLRDQKNREYRGIIKDTLAFDPGILQRFVNFMNNPDEETAVNQFGKDDRYFAVCTLLVTLPGLPMIGHGQIEGFSEKYGMEYTRAFHDEEPDEELIARHEREIFPLLTRRHLFAEATSFRLYDLHGEEEIVESVYAYSNTVDDECVLIVVNNSHERAVGTINHGFPSEMNHDTLAAVLVPEGRDINDWLLLRDNVADLWYIRSIRDLQDNGMTIRIDGFACQTFLDIHTVAETKDGMWKALADEAGGAGVKNPYTATAQIRLRPVKEALAALLPCEAIRELAENISRGKYPRKLAHRKVIETAISRLKNCGSEDLEDSSMIADRILARLESAAKLWRFPRRYLKNRLRRNFGDAEIDEAMLLTLWSLLADLEFEQWGELDLSHWMNEHLSLAPSLCRNLVLALKFPPWIRSAKTPILALNTLMASSDVRQACGVNHWNGITWYNGEGWNAFARMAILIAGTEQVSWWTIFRLIWGWAKTNKAAGYRLERLLNPIY